MQAWLPPNKKTLVRIAIAAISTACFASLQLMRNKPPSADYTRSVKEMFDSAIDPQAPSPPSFVTDIQPTHGIASNPTLPDDTMPMVTAPPSASEGGRIIACLSDPNPAIRSEALIQLIRLGIRAGESTLLPLATDPDPEVRTMAVLALGIQGAPMGLIMRSFEDSDTRVRNAGYQAMGYYQNLKAIEVLFRLPRDGQAQALVAESLNRILFPATRQDAKSESATVAPSIH